MTEKGERRGGLRIDPAVEAFQKQAARNVAAQTKKQRADAKRVRVRLDVWPEFKERLVAMAAAEEVTVSRFGAFLLDWALDQYEADEELREAVDAAKVPSGSMRIKWNLRF